MQNHILKVVKQNAEQRKRQILSALYPDRYLKKRSKQQVGRGKTVLITGASSGLGEGMARLFAKLGYNLAICARRTDRLERLTSELVAEYPDIRVEYRALDVSNYDEIFSVFDAFAADFDGIDRVVVNAVWEIVAVLVKAVLKPTVIQSRSILYPRWHSVKRR